MKNRPGHAHRAPSAVVGFEDLCKLSGYSKPTFVAKWLQSQKIFYRMNAKNQPVTTSSVLDDWMDRGRKTVPNINFGSRS